jgi:hypothetical protein
MIEFDNETENFELPSRAALSPINFLTVRITYNGNSKRMNIPHILKLRFSESPFVRFYWSATSGNFYIDFKPNEDDIIPEKIDTKDTHITATGRGYFVTLPTRWFKHIKPTKASLMQIEEKKTVYKVQFYGND